MADWSELPLELLTLIAERLETRFDVLRLRSVCSSWLNSLYPPKVYPLPEWFTSKTRVLFEYSVGHIHINTLYLVRLPGAGAGAGAGANRTAPPAACWLVNIRDGTQLLNPLSDSELNPLPAKFPKVLDLTKFQVIELGHRYFGQNNSYYDYRMMRRSVEFRNKVAIIWLRTNSDDFMMLASFYYIPYVVSFRSGQMKSTLLEYVDGVEDIISFKGKFYAIEKKGSKRTLIIDQSLNVSFMQHVGYFDSRKFLVQSGDNLLAVELLYFYPRPRGSVSDAQRPLRYGINGVGFRIFRMDEEEQKWDKMESLGDQILFLGYGQAISALASEFYWGKGNLIFYSRSLVFPGDSRIIVFDIETGTASPVEKCPAYCNLLWSPPEWVTSAESLISSTQVVSNSSATPEETAYETEYESPDSHFSICTTEVGGKSPERMASAFASPRSKHRFKFCCF